MSAESEVDALASMEMSHSGTSSGATDPSRRRRRARVVLTYPRHSMYMPYMPTSTPQTTPMYLGIYGIHGVSGYGTGWEVLRVTDVDDMSESNTDISAKTSTTPKSGVLPVRLPPPPSRNGVRTQWQRIFIQNSSTKRANKVQLPAVTFDGVLNERRVPLGCPASTQSCDW